MRPLLMNPTNAPNSRAQDLCPITRAPIAHAPRRTALTSAEMLPARESGSGRPAGPWNTAGLWNATGAWNTLGAWNIAVRTRGVFTHRADFGKPACAKRELVRTANQPESGKLNPFQANAADRRFLPFTYEINWKYSILPPPHLAK